MFNYDEHLKNIRTGVSVTEFRKHLADYIAMVRYGDDWVCIRRKGKDPVWLISQADMDLIWERRDDLHAGPRDDAGHRSGNGFMSWWRKALLRDQGRGL
ncbi:type II toxin-antitoxin system Phd/YefM family antitoxin [Rhodobacteraceae bacterium]|nr:type II toxin-antitoxin system Phd/YefM family antitoxin [Paracoccaceae bacterium]